jgi:hypothetical protein
MMAEVGCGTRGGLRREKMDDAARCRLKMDNCQSIVEPLVISLGVKVGQELVRGEKETFLFPVCPQVHHHEEMNTIAL